MRLTKIHARKYSRFICFALGSLLTLGATFYFMPQTTEVKTEIVESKADTLQLKDFLSGYRVVSSWNPPSQLPSFELDNSGNRLTSDELRSMGFDITVNSSCHISISSGSSTVEVHC